VLSANGELGMKILIIVASFFLLACSGGTYIDPRNDFEASLEARKYRIVTKSDSRYFAKKIKIQNDTIQFNNIKLPTSEIYNVVEYRYSRKRTVMVLILAPAAAVLLGAGGYIGYSRY
jgi:hypothetical protein